MKRKILFIVLCSFLLTGVVSAASIWGYYKGSQIIRLTVDGVPVKVSDVPAISYNGRTMIPIYLLQQAGIQYSWDGKNQTVDIKQMGNSVGTQPNKSDLATWANTADYFFELVSISSDFYNANRHLDTVIDLVGGRNNPSNLDTMNKAADRLKQLNTDYHDLKQRYSRRVHDDMNAMKHSTSKLDEVEKYYDQALGSLVDSYGIIVELIKTNNPNLVDQYFTTSMAVNDDIFLAKKNSTDEFKKFQNGIIIGE